MTFELEKGEGVSERLLRLIRSDAQKGRAMAKTLHLPNAVHDVRKLTKRVRAMARLVRDSVGGDTYHQINEAARSAARPLGPARDAEVLLDTLTLVEREPGLSPAAIAPIRRALELEEAAIKADLLKNAEIQDRVSQLFQEVRVSVKEWTFIKRRSKLRSGLDRTYSACRESLAAVMVDSSVEALHEWRKQAKYLFHQVYFLQGVRPRAVKRQSAKLHRLGQWLGENHDLAVLSSTCVERADELQAREVLEPLLIAVRSIRSRLEKQAIEHGRHFFRHDSTVFLPGVLQKP